MPRLGDHEAAAYADDARRFAQDRLDVTRVIVPGEFTCLLRRLDVGQSHDATLGLRDDLVRDDEYVAVLELRRVCDQRGDVVALADLAQSLHRDDVQPVHATRARSRSTASRTMHSARWSFTTPHACSVA